MTPSASRHDFCMSGFYREVSACEELSAPTFTLRHAPVNLTCDRSKSLSLCLGSNILCLLFRHLERRRPLISMLNRVKTMSDSSCQIVSVKEVGGCPLQVITCQGNLPSASQSRALGGTYGIIFKPQPLP
jgi:hypothetical protein